MFSPEISNENKGSRGWGWNCLDCLPSMHVTWGLSCSTTVFTASQATLRHNDISDFPRGQDYTHNKILCQMKEKQRTESQLRTISKLCQPQGTACLFWNCPCVTRPPKSVDFSHIHPSVIEDKHFLFCWPPGSRWCCVPNEQKVPKKQHSQPSPIFSFKAISSPLPQRKISMSKKRLRIKLFGWEVKMAVVHSMCFWLGGWELLGPEQVSLKKGTCRDTPVSFCFEGKHPSIIRNSFIHVPDVHASLPIIFKTVIKSH